MHIRNARIMWDKIGDIPAPRLARYEGMDYVDVMDLRDPVNIGLRSSLAETYRVDAFPLMTVHNSAIKGVRGVNEINCNNRSIALWEKDWLKFI